MSATQRPANEWRAVGIALLAIGAAVVVLTVLAYRDNVDTLAGDRRQVAALELEIDSVRKAWQRDTVAESTARLRDDLRRREFLLGRRAFHVPVRAESVARWWRPGGTGFTALVIATLLIVLGAISLHRARRLSDPRPVPPGG
jgi:hypothetical protein